MSPWVACYTQAVSAPAVSGTLISFRKITKNKMAVIFLTNESNLTPSVLENPIASWYDDAYSLLYTNKSQVRNMLSHALPPNFPIFNHSFIHTLTQQYVNQQIQILLSK